MENSDEIRLSDLIHSVVKHRVLILLLTLAGLIIGAVIAFVSFALGEISKEYAITTSIAITAQAPDGIFSSRYLSPNSTDVHLAEDMADSVIYVLKSDRMLNTAIDRMDLVGVSASSISSHLNLNQFRETQIIELTLYWRSAEEGVQILNAINASAPTVLGETLKVGSVSVINPPVAKYRIGGSVNASLWVLMTIMGLLMGLAISICITFLFPTMIASEDLENGMGLSILQEIPANTKFYSQRRSPLSDDLSRLGADLRDSYASAARILSHQLGEGPHRICITSAIRSEGRTSAAAALAAQLANQGHKVLLADLDVQNPSLGGLFLDQVDYHHSLNALFRGDVDAENAVFHLSGCLDLLPAVLENRELPLDDSLLHLVESLFEGYDYVLLDTAPAGLFADTLGLNSITDGCLLTVRYDFAQMRDIETAVTRLQKSGTDILGCIVTDVKKLDKAVLRLRPGKTAPNQGSSAAGKKNGKK